MDVVVYAPKDRKQATASGAYSRFGRVHNVVFSPDGRRVVGIMVKRPDVVAMVAVADAFVALDALGPCDGGLRVTRGRDAYDELAQERLGLDWDRCIIWVGMVAWFAAELICHWQTIKWDLGEIFPHAKKRSNAIACYIGAQVVFVACYYWIWSSIDDPLVQVMIATTVIFCTLFVPQFLSVRNSTRGVSAAALWAVLIAQVAWWFFAIPAMDPAWGTIYTYFFGACGVAVGIASLYKYYQLRREGRESIESGFHHEVLP